MKDWEAKLKAAEEVEKDYHVELQRNKNLSAELQSVQSQLDSLKSEFEKKFANLRQEAERLKSIYPLYDLLAAKQAEVERMKKALKTVAPDHSERAAIEAMVKSHIVERDELRELVEEAEQRFKHQLEKLQINFNLSHTVPAYPGSQPTRHSTHHSTIQTDDLEEEIVRAPEF